MTPEGVQLAQSSRLEDPEQLRRRYFFEQHHEDLVDFLDFLPTSTAIERDPQGYLLLIMTHSPLSSLEDVRLFSENQFLSIILNSTQTTLS